MALSGDPAVTTPIASPVIRLGLDLKRAQHLLRQQMDDRLRPLGLNAGLWSLLHEMAGTPGASSSELARSAFQTPQTVGGLVQRLIGLGLVERQQARGRVVENHLTARGIEVYRRATDIVDILMTSVVANLSDDDRDRLATLLAMLVTTLGAGLEGHDAG
jgi:DNA-binding MarR family transcriptional regulator